MVLNENLFEAVNPKIIFKDDIYIDEDDVGKENYPEQWYQHTLEIEKYPDYYQVYLDSEPYADFEDIDELNTYIKSKDWEIPNGFYLKEDTIKQGNKWVNKGKEGTHGSFKTKKQADAQRKAMFAQGYKEDFNTLESLSLLDRAYNGSYYTIIGAGGDIEEWKKGYQDLLDKENIGTIKEWITFKGSDMNTKYNLTGDNAYPDNLTFLAFPIDNLDVNKLSIFKIKMQDRWFDDIVDNNLKREGIDESLNEEKNVQLKVRDLKEGDKILFPSGIAEIFQIDKWDDYVTLHYNGSKGEGWHDYKYDDFVTISNEEIIDEAYDLNNIKHKLDLFANQITVPAEKENEIIDLLQSKNISFIIDDHLDSEGKPGKNFTFKLKYPKVVKESVDPKANENGPKTKDTGIAQFLIDAINGEWDTIKLYNDLMVNLESYGYSDIADIIRDINNEENIHVGQLQKALETISPNVNSINDGEQEAEEQLTNTTEVNDLQNYELSESKDSDIKISKE